jgi:outer membrane protein TolC
VPEILRSLRHPNYRRYFLGQLVSMTGTWMQMMAQTWLVYRLTGSAWLLGLVAFSSQIPSLLIGVLGGSAADHFDRRRLLLVTQSVALVHALVLGLLTVTDSVRVWQVFVLAIILGVVNVFDMPARQSMISELVDERADLPNAIALNTLMINSSRLTGPAIAGLLVASRGEGFVFLLNAASFLASLAALLSLKLPARPPRPAPSPRETAAHVVEGLRYTLGDGPMRSLLALLAAVSLFGMPSYTLLPLFAGRLGLGAKGVGWLMSASGSGAVAASVFLAMRGSLDGLPRLVGAAAAVFGAALVCFAASPSLGTGALCMAVAGWGMMTAFVGGNTLLQSRTSDHMRGRTMALFSMTFMGMAPIGNLASGWLAARLGASAAVVAGGLAVVAAAAVFRSRRTWAALALLLLAGGPACAQRALTWQEAVDLAIRRNPELESSRRSVEARQADARGSYNGLLPGVSLSNSYSDSSAAGPNRYSASVSANMDLLDAGRFADVKSASASLSLSRASLRQASASLRFSLRQAFAQSLAATRNLEVSRAVREMRERGARLVALRYDSGREGKGNMLRAQAQLVQADVDLRQAARRQRADMKALDRQLGLDDFDVIVATGVLGAEPAPEAPDRDRTQALLAGRPDIAVSEASVRSAEAGVSQARSTLYPSLSGSYTRSRTGPKEFPNGQRSWSGGLTLSLPLFGGGPASTFYSVKSANRDLDGARQDLRAARNAAVADLESAWASYAYAYDLVGVQRALLAAARQRNDEADIRYASGLLTYDNWEIIATDRINRERSVVDAELNAAVAQAAWERAIGKELGE